MELNVDKDQWDKLTAQEQGNITQIISKNFPEANIVANGAASPAFKGDVFCEIACSTAEAAAIAACAGNPICIAIAHAAGEACRREC